jgi:hypothetical protein
MVPYSNGSRQPDCRHEVVANIAATTINASVACNRKDEAFMDEN